MQREDFETSPVTATRYVLQNCVVVEASVINDIAVFLHVRIPLCHRNECSSEVGPVYFANGSNRVVPAVAKDSCGALAPMEIIVVVKEVEGPPNSALIDVSIHVL